MLTRKGSSAGPELYGGHDDTALAHGLVDMASRFCYWLNFVGWVWSDSAQVLVTNLGGLASLARWCLPSIPALGKHTWRWVSVSEVNLV